jgi:integrase/recombinase XerD
MHLTQYFGENRMTNLSFQDLTASLERELLRLHYSEPTLKSYRRMWRRISTFLEDKGVDHFTEENGMRFIDKEYDFLKLEKAGELKQSDVNAFRIIRMLGDFQQHGSILRRYYKQKELLQTDEFKEIRLLFESHCQRKEYAVATINHYRKITDKFLSFLESKSLKQVSNITAKHLSDYICTLLGFSYKTIEQQLCGLRSFLRYLHGNDLHQQDLTTAIPPL